MWGGERRSEKYKIRHVDTLRKLICSSGIYPIICLLRADSFPITPSPPPVRQETKRTLYQARELPCKRHKEQTHKSTARAVPWFQLAEDWRSASIDFLSKGKESLGILPVTSEPLGQLQTTQERSNASKGSGTQVAKEKDHVIIS